MDLSTRLSYLFGTEEYVHLRRQLVLVRENLMGLGSTLLNVNHFCGGSFGEGLVYPLSDDDLMIYIDFLRVVTRIGDLTQSGDVLMVPSEYCPGYCLLLDVIGTFPYVFTYTMHEMQILSSTLWKQFFLEDAFGQYIHGPCASGSIDTAEYDRAHALLCYSWPDIANDWVRRNRIYDWPSFEMIQNIYQNGCHVVPIGDPDSPFCFHEWRISFSVAERTLMHSLNHAHFLVYNLLRLILKKIIEKLFPDVLCSYFMKTVLFYTVENTSPLLWRVDNLEACLKSCLSMLIYYVDNSYCPNYFIPENNMIKRKVNQTNRHQILGITKVVHSLGIYGILILSGASICLGDSLLSSIIEHKLDREFLFSDHFHYSLQFIERFFHRLLHESTGCPVYSICKFGQLLESYTNVIQSELINILWNTGQNSYCRIMMVYLFTVSKVNKYNYRLYRILEYVLKKAYKADVTTGKLTMATYLYMVGKPKSALYIIRQLLSDYTPYVFDFTRNETKARAYVDMMCSKGYTIDYKVRHALAPEYDIYDACTNAYPSAMRLWITIMHSVNLDPLIYAYFLKSLCNIQCQDQHSLIKSIKCLINKPGNQDDGYSFAKSRMCVGIIKYVQGDRQSACRWLASAYILKDKIFSPSKERFSLAVLSYFSCLIKKYFHS